jgi:biotin synthase-related radical SAM superfamily protein
MVEQMESYADRSRAKLESPEYVRTSLAAAMTLGLVPGQFLRGAKLYCLNFLLTYDDGCVGRCAYCGLSRGRRSSEAWSERSFIRVDWPTVSVVEVVERLDAKVCPHVERACVSMVTNRRARQDLLTVASRLRGSVETMSALITPTIVDYEWLVALRESGVDRVGVAVDAAYEELFDRLRGSSVGGPHKWDRYWKVVEDSVRVFGRYKAGVHLIVGLGETEEEMVRAVQRAHDMGALTHLFSFYPEEGSQMEGCQQPPIGQYRRVQLARYLINKGLSRVEDMKFGDGGRLRSFGVTDDEAQRVVESGLPFLTSGCASRSRENACNRPFSDYTPQQALLGEVRNYPFPPDESDIRIIKEQLKDYSLTPSKSWVADADLALISLRD